jgi:hypothetical protein
MSRLDNKELIAEINQHLKDGVPAEKMVRLAEVLDIDPGQLELPGRGLPAVGRLFQYQRVSGKAESIKSYAAAVDELQNALDTGQANYVQRQVAYAIGLEPRYSNKAFTHYSQKDMPGLDQAKLNKLAVLGVDLATFNKAAPADKATRLNEAINSWLGSDRAKAQPAKSNGIGGAGASSRFDGAKDGAGASSSIRPSGGPKAGPNPKHNVAAQKEASDKAWNETISQLGGPPPWARPGKL